MTNIEFLSDWQTLETLTPGTPAYNAVRDRLVAAQSEWTRCVARGFWRDATRPEVLDDLTQGGLQGVLASIPRFDYRRGVPFQAFCLVRVLGKMKDWARRYFRQQREQTGYEDKSEDAATTLIERADELAVRRGGNSGDPVVAAISEEQEQMTLACTQHLLRTLTPVQRKVVLALVVEGRSRRAIACALDQSPEWVERVYQQALRQLRRRHGRYGLAGEPVCRALQTAPPA